MNNQQNLINIRDRMSPALVKKQGVWSREDTKCWCWLLTSFGNCMQALSKIRELYAHALSKLRELHALSKLWELHAGS